MISFGGDDFRHLVLHSGFLQLDVRDLYGVLQRLRVRNDSRVDFSCDDEVLFQIKCMLGFVRQVRGPVLHFRDAALGICRTRPLVIRNLFVLTGLIKTLQLLNCRLDR